MQKNCKNVQNLEKDIIQTAKIKSLSNQYLTNIYQLTVLHQNFPYV